MSSEQFAQTIIEGFRIAVKKVVDEAKAKKDYIVIADKDGNVQHVYPHLEDEQKKAS
jgi:hypothetical protein